MTGQAGRFIMPGMAENLRRYSFKLYPNAAQTEALEHQRRMHCDLYNALLQQRVEAYRRQGRTLGYYDQCKELTALRNDAETAPDWSALSSDAMAATAQRVDRAFKAFFDRARKGMGHQSGFPRFKPGRTYPGFSFKRHGSGWNLRWKGKKGGDCYFKAVPGRVKFRGRLPAEPERIKTCELLWREERWWLSLVVEMPLRCEAGHEDLRVAFDLIDSFARVSRENGGCAAGPDDTAIDFVAAEGRIIPRYQGANRAPGAETPENGGDRRDQPANRQPMLGAETPENGGDRRGPDAAAGYLRGAETPENGGDRRWSRWIALTLAGAETPESGGDRRGMRNFSRLIGGAETLESLQAARTRCKRGSCKYRALSRRIARLQGKAARRRREALHRWTTDIASGAAKLTIVSPDVKAATASGHGDERDWGAAVELKAKLNRHVLDQAPALATQMLEYKVREGGGEVAIVKSGDHGVTIGNDVVAATKQNRKLKRSMKRASRSKGSDRKG